MMVRPTNDEFEIIMGKGENDGDKYFSFSHNIFYFIIDKSRLKSHPFS